MARWNRGRSLLVGLISVASMAFGMAFVAASPAAAPQSQTSCKQCDMYTQNQQVMYDCIPVPAGSTTCTATSSACSESGPCMPVTSTQGLVRTGS